MKSDEEKEELNMTEEELQRWVQAEVNRDEQLVRRRAQLAQVEDWVKRKEREASYTRLLYSNACESVLECESVMKGLYGMLGLEYRDTDSEEEEGAKPKENIIQIADDDDGEDECGDDVSADGDDDYVVIDLGAAVPDSSSEVKPKVEPSETSVQVLGQTDKKIKAVNTVDLVTMLETSPSRSPEPSIISLPIKKDRESPVPISSNPSPDVLPSTSFRPISPPLKRENSPARNSESCNSSLPTIKTRDSPVPISSPLLSDLPPTSFTPIHLPTKRERSPSRSPEPSIYSLPTIKTRKSPVPVSCTSSPDVLSFGTFKPVASPTKKEISPSGSPEPSNNLLSTIKTRESPLPISSVSSPDVLSPLCTPISTPTPSYTAESSPLTTAPPTPSVPVNNVETIAKETSVSTEQNSEAPAPPEASSKTSASSTKSSLALTSSNKVSVNQKQVSSGTSSTTPSNSAGETSEKAKSASVTHVTKPSSSVTSSTTTHSTSTAKANTTSTTASTAAPSTTTSTKPSDAKEVSQAQPARVQKEVELKVDMNVFGRRRTKTWHQGTILEIKSTASGNRYKVKFEGDKGKSVLSGHHLACVNCPMLKDLFVGCRVVARYKEDDQSWLHAAIITEMPDRKNRMRFMVFFDDGRAAYVSLPDLHLVCKPLKNIYEDIEDDGPRIEVEEYLKAYPNPIFVVVRVGQESKAERDGKWEDCTISQVDASLVQICYTKDKEKEWFYKGSNRLDHIQRIKKRMAGQKTEQPSNKVVSVTNQGSTTTTAATTTTASSTTTTAAPATTATATTAANATSKTTSSRVTTQPVALRPSTPKSVTRTAAKPISQPKIVLHRINNPEAYLSTVAVSKATLPTEPIVTSPSNKGTKRPAEVDFYQNVPPPVVEPRLKYVPHRCCPTCLDQVRPTQKDQYRSQNPLLIPLLYGFRRMTGRKRLEGKMSFHVFYRAPCARSMCKMEEVQDFLFESRCDFLFLDMFCLDPFVLVKRAMLPSSISSRPNLFLPDISQGKEAVPVPCVNELDSACPPPLNYTRHRVPAPGVVINTSLDFMMGCDCTDGCRDRSKCSCQQLTIEATSLFTGGPADVTVGYANKRLTGYVPTGVYECNPLCRCDPWMCSNRLVQHGLQLRLQLFMTQHKGWGIRCLDDISKGTFVCIFTGKVVTDDMASMEASMSGNEYLANLDYIEEVEKLKEGYESEAYCSEAEQEGEKKVLVRMTTGSLKKHDVFTRDSSSGEEMEVSDQQKTERNERSGRWKSKTNDCEDENVSCSGDEDEDDDMDDEDYKVSSDEADVNPKRLNVDCQRTYITRRNAKILNVDEDIHSDLSPPLPPKLVEDQTEVSPSMAKQMRKEGPGEARVGFARKTTRNFAIKSFHRKVKQPEVPKEKPQEKTTHCRRNTRSLFNNEKACYLIDAKDKGNIGRFINHSCSPNLFVQNVFVDTHDLRFPWVAFFASKRIRAGTELTWDYGYEVGSVEGNVLLCCCGSAECKGRLL